MGVLNKRIQKLAVLLMTFVIVHCSCEAQMDLLTRDQANVSKPYDSCFSILKNLLITNGSFKQAVFLTESLYDNQYADFVGLDNKISDLRNLCYLVYKSKERNLNGDGFDTDYFFNYAIKSVINDTTYLVVDSLFIGHKPFTFDWIDPLGKKNWSNMFVSKLLVTHKGNCHSLAYLYKILADELGVRCWLSLAPNHIYIRNYNTRDGWYNTELTSGTFPTDAWIATTGYVSTDAIRSGIYMDTLSNRQSIALCVLDLAKGYEFQTHNYYDGFILNCCDLVLQYHPVNPMALLLKAETLKKVYFKQVDENTPDSSTTFATMEQAYITLAKLHYREMPEKMYREWLLNIARQKGNYSGEQIKQETKSRRKPSPPKQKSK